jgi:hypothetical protein
MRASRPLLLALALSVALPAAEMRTAKTLDLDVERGHAGLFVSPSVESALTGSRQARTAGLTRVAAETGTTSRTAWGDPNLEGIWDFRTATPLERPGEFEGREFLAAEEIAEFERRRAGRTDGRAWPEEPPLTNHAPWWLDYGTTVNTTKRTSLIVDPPDGRIPPLTLEGQKRADAFRAARLRPATGPEDRGLAERCITGFNAGPPMLPGAYNNNVQIFQTPGYVVLLNEMVHDARIVPVDGQPHLPRQIRQWMGDSRGRWEGATLVVETTNFKDETNFRNASARLQVIERFTRTGADTLLYEFTVTDPSTWIRSWSAAVSMKKTQGPMFEYACHEGNYGLRNILGNARAEDRSAPEAR